MEGYTKDDFPMNGVFRKIPLVYFVTDNNGSIKIGVTNDIERRIRDLQTGNPNILGILSLWKCDSMFEANEIEKMLHSHFESIRKCGEWFEYAPIKEWLLEQSDFPNWWSRGSILMHRAKENKK